MSQQKEELTSPDLFIFQNHCDREEQVHNQSNLQNDKEW